MAKVKKSPPAAVKSATKTAIKTAEKVASVEVTSSGLQPKHRGAGHDGAIEPAKGKLGVMIPGMGAVATTCGGR